MRKTTQIKYPDPKRSNIFSIIKEKILLYDPEEKGINHIRIDLTQLEKDGYKGKFEVLIKKDESYFETEFNHTNATRFPQRIKATALALRETSNFGEFSIFHEKGILIVDRINETLKNGLNNHSKSENNSWIYQGNPKNFDIDQYISTHQFIYWYSPLHKNEIKVGDTSLIWRSGESAGLIAVGKVVEQPTNIASVNFPELTAEHLWYKAQNIDESKNTKVGMEIFEARINKQDGMLDRESLKLIPRIKSHRIITNPIGTVFRIEEELKDILIELWSNRSHSKSDHDYYSQSVLNQEPTKTNILEGRRRLVVHERRERSQTLRRIKTQKFKEENGKLNCELCYFVFNEKYPPELAADFIEVHHIRPISDYDVREPTKLEDLMLVCPNCHRMIHRTKDVAKNLIMLKKWFSKIN